MTFYFFDSSAFIKVFVQETGTADMVRLMESIADNQKLVSAVASVEVRSAIRRRERSGEIEGHDAEDVLQILAGEMLRIVAEPVSPPVLELARGVLDRHPLRALDALQLASCLNLRETLRATDVCFVASDKVLLQAAQREGLQVFNPEQEENAQQ